MSDQQTDHGEMSSMRTLRTATFALVAIVLFSIARPQGHSQAALLMEEPYGFFGTLNPTGHTAIYFENICAETPVKLRRCTPGEQGTVIARYSGIADYDWVAIPLVPYLYSVENINEVPDRVDHAFVVRLREKYHETHLLSLGEDIRPGGFLHGGWTELVGVSYERRIYAFRFDTTSAQDDAFIARMNADKNHSEFKLLFNNCADFARVIMNHYFPGTFSRSIFPDAGMTTPKQITYKLERYARKHPETNLAVFEIPQVPGNRRLSHSNKSIAESLVTTGYAVPIAILNPYLAGGLFVDYLVRGHHNLIPKNHEILSPDNLDALTAPTADQQNPVSAGTQATPAAVTVGAEVTSAAAVPTPGLRELPVEHDANPTEF
jgi:hypothetical protein